MHARVLSALSVAVAASVVVIFLAATGGTLRPPASVYAWAPWTAAAAPTVLPWVLLAALAERNFSAGSRHLAAGCPPRPRLCALGDIFDDIIVISLPRFAARARRITAQLSALGAAYTLVHAHDSRAVGAAVPLFSGELGKEPSILALWLTHVAVLDHIARSPVHRVLLLEDDATFAADFPRAFDAAARALPAGWRTFFLGQSILWHRRDDAACAPQGSPLAPRRSGASCASVYGAFAVAFSRRAAARVLAVMLDTRMPIDTAPFDAEWAENSPNASLLALPPLVAMQQFGESTLAHCWSAPPWAWKRHNLVAAERFDLAGPGFVAGGAAAPRAPAEQCSRGLRFRIGAAFDDADVCSGRVRAASAQACCQLCVDSFPACAAWTFVGGGNDDEPECALKVSAARLRQRVGLATISGELEVELGGLL